MLNANYSERTANNGYRFLDSKNIIEYLQEHNTPEQDKSEIIAWFKHLRSRSENKRDFGNSNRANEALARINAMFTDKQQIDANITEQSPFIADIDKIIERHS